MKYYNLYLKNSNLFYELVIISWFITSSPIASALARSASSYALANRCSSSSSSAAQILKLHATLLRLHFGHRETARLWLAPVFVVVVRWSIDLNVISIISCVPCTDIADEEYFESFFPQKKEIIM